MPVIRRHWNRNAMKALYVPLAILTGLAFGCSAPSFRSQSPESTEVESPQVKLVGDLARPYGMHRAQIEGVAMVTNLNSTGSDPAPSIHRSKLVEEMRRNDVPANQILASPSTALVLVRGYLRPGIQKGDRFDVELRVPSRSQTKSLRNGFMMETSLRNVAVLNNAIHDGHIWGKARGPVLTEPSADEDDVVALGRARVLGGAVALKSREIGLSLKSGHQSVRNASAIGAAINERFHRFDHGIKSGIATPRTNERIELTIPPQYKDNVARLMKVLQSVPINELPVVRQSRLKSLETQLLDPVTSSTAALRLEAIGHEAIPVLRTGLMAADPEVRFYSAEALAYLDESDAAAPLAEAARDEPAFRMFALSALSAMDNFEAYDALKSLLSAPSAETRYGAFRALWAMNPVDPFVVGEKLSSGFSLHVVETAATPMVHVTRSFRPEVVVFGTDVAFESPLLLEAGRQILVKSTDDGQVAVSSFTPGSPPEKRIVSANVAEVIRAVAEVGGSYPDVVEMLQHANGSGALETRLAVDAIPRAGRSYRRQRDGGAGDFEERVATLLDEGDTPRGVDSSSPRPSLFPEIEEKPQRRPAEPRPTTSKKRRPLGRLFDKISR